MNSPWSQFGTSEKVLKGSMWRLLNRCRLWWLVVLDRWKMQRNQRSLSHCAYFSCVHCLRKSDGRIVEVQVNGAKVEAVHVLCMPLLGPNLV